MKDFDVDKLSADVFIHFGWAFTDKTGRNDVSKQPDWEKLLPWNIEITPFELRGEWLDLAK